MKITSTLLWSIGLEGFERRDDDEISEQFPYWCREAAHGERFSRF
jgi:hypothetical protein